jgi:hypothetical protein
VIIYPNTLVPDYVIPERLPNIGVSFLTPGNQYISHSIAHTDTPIGGLLRFTFKNRNINTITECSPFVDPAAGILAAPGSITKMGFADAWLFYLNTCKGSRLKFQIPSTSPVWRRLGYYPAWASVSNGGADSLWRIVKFEDNSGEHIAATRDFSMIVAHELRTPAWV